MLLSSSVISEEALELISADIVRLADAHWVAPLLAHRVLTAHSARQLPEEVRSVLRHQLCFEGGFELITSRELRALLDACSDAQIDVLLLKGAALAYTHYPAAHLRPRLDTDLLLRDRQRSAMASLLTRRGYVRTPSAAGDANGAQEQYVRALEGGLLHAIDVHWKIANPRAFADLLAFDELRASAVPVTALGPAARTPGPVDTLLLLVIHRMAHHERDEDLLCMSDMHLVAQALTAPQWQSFIAACRRLELETICAEALATATALIPTTVPPPVAEWIAVHRTGPVPRRFAAFARRDRRVADVIVSDFLWSDGWLARLRLLRAHLLPPPKYMAARYDTTRRWALPWLYARRVAAGIPRVLARGRFR